MKKIQQVNLDSLITQQTGHTNSPISKSDAEFINDLFTKIAAARPAWKVALDTDELMAEAKRQWLTGFLEAGINTQELIDRGMAGLRSEPKDFLPSVGRFIEWCRPSELWQHKGPAYQEFRKDRLLEKKKASKEFAQDALSKIREQMKKQ